MKKLFLYLIPVFLILFQSCSKKEVQLPLIEIEGIHEIQNHSAIWVFFETKNQDTLAILNKNNKLLNTHWIFNIDRRLPMGKVVPILEDLQANRNKDSMHKKEGMLNYFSYADQVANQMSLINFLPTNYLKNKEDYTKFLSEESSQKFVVLEIKNGDFFADHTVLDKTNLKGFIEKMTHTDSLKEPILSLKYSKNLSYQDYLSTKAFLFYEGFQVDQTEYIYTVK